MSQEISSNVGKPMASSGEKHNGWWWHNWLALFSLGVAAVGIGMSYWAVRVSLATDRRAQRVEAAEASAEATQLADRAGRVFMVANMAHSIIMQAEKEEALDGKMSRFTLSLLGEALLPPLSPTTGELEELARSGDDTAGHLALCVKWRNTAEVKVEALTTGKGRLFEPLQAEYAAELVRDLSNVSKACEQAADDLTRLSVPDPVPDTFSQPVVLKRLIPPPLTPPPHASGIN